MEKILNNSAPNKIVSAFEENIGAWIPVYGKLGQVTENNPIGVIRSITDYPEPVFNSILDKNLAPDQVEFAIKTVISDAKTRNIPVLWWIVPSTQPVDLPDQLKNFGFCSDKDDPGMVVDLERLDETLPKPKGFSIQHAQNDSTWKQWSITMQLGFEVPSLSEMKIRAWLDMLQQSDPNNVFAFTGFLNDQPVATTLLFLAGGVAGLYCVATIPEARRLGIGAGMTLFTLLQARSMGYKVGVLYASDMGKSVYLSLGFQQFCRIGRYHWVP